MRHKLSSQPNCSPHESSGDVKLTINDLEAGTAGGVTTEPQDFKVLKLKQLALFQ